MFPATLPTFSALVLSFFPSFLAPQGPTPNCNALPENVIPWPPPAVPPFGVAAGFERVVVGKLVDGVDADAACLANRVVTVLFQPQGCAGILRVEFESAAPLDDVDDIAVLPLGAPGKDLLLATDARGLLGVSMAPIGPNSIDSPSFLEPVVIDALAWRHAAPIHVVDLDHSGGLDIIGLAADGVTILGLRWGTSGFIANPPITAQAPVIDFDACDWDESNAGDTSAVEIVALTQAGLRVFEQSGTLVSSRPSSATSGALEVLQLTPTNTVVAWGLPVGSGPWRLVLLDGDSVGLPGPVTLTFNLCPTTLSPHPIALVAGNYNSDGRDDLLVAYEDNRTGVVLVNQDNGVPFRPYDTAAYSAFSLDMPNWTTGGIGIPAFAQIDAYGPEDLIVPAKWGKVEVFLSLPWYGGDPNGAQQIDSADIARVGTEYLPGDLGNPSKLEFHFKRIAAYIERLHLEVRCWKRPAASGGEWYLLKDAVKHWMITLDTTGGIDSLHRVELDGLPTSDVWSDGEHYYYDYRFVTWVGGSVTNPSPWYQGGIVVRKLGEQNGGYTDSEKQALVNQGGVIANSYLDLEIGTSGDSRTAVGGYVSMTRLPPFRPGDVPNPNASELVYGSSTKIP